jgi:hypothetical protein
MHEIGGLDSCNVGCTRTNRESLCGVQSFDSYLILVRGRHVVCHQPSLNLCSSVLVSVWCPCPFLNFSSEIEVTVCPPSSRIIHAIQARPFFYNIIDKIQTFFSVMLIWWPRVQFQSCSGLWWWVELQWLSPSFISSACPREKERQQDSNKPTTGKEEEDAIASAASFYLCGPFRWRWLPLTSYQVTKLNFACTLSCEHDFFYHLIECDSENNFVRKKEVCIAKMPSQTKMTHDIIFTSRWLWTLWDLM